MHTSPPSLSSSPLLSEYTGHLQQFASAHSTQIPFAPQAACLSHAKCNTSTWFASYAIWVMCMNMVDISNIDDPQHTGGIVFTGGNVGKRQKLLQFAAVHMQVQLCVYVFIPVLAELDSASFTPLQSAL